MAILFKLVMDWVVEEGCAVRANCWLDKDNLIRFSTGFKRGIVLPHALVDSASRKANFDEALLVLDCRAL